MGGSQSSRKLSVDNDNAIQVSQEALDRIQTQLAAKQAEQPPPSQYSPPPVFESQRRHQEHIAEEAYWARRIENLKRAHDNINSGMQVEYEKTLKEANKLFELVRDDKFAKKLTPCENEKAQMLQCYDTNADKPLICSVLVNQFNDCVCKSRLAAITTSS